MKKFTLLISCLGLVVLLAAPAMAATQQQIQQSIDDGLKWLHDNMTTSGSEGYWPYSNDGTVAATASAALAFIGEGYLPGDGSAYGGTVQKACNYIFNRVANDSVGKYFDPKITQAAYTGREIYTTGICAPVVYELGKALGPNSVIGFGSGAVSTLTYKQAMQGVMDWYEWGQNSDVGHWEEGGWGYYPNSGSSDNSTAQWGALPFLYGNAWSLSIPASVQAGLEIWTNRVQNPIDAWTDWKDGGSGYSNNTQYVNMAKTGGMLLEFAVQGKTLAHSDVANALYYMQSMETFDHWNQSATGWPDQWNGGNFGNPYSMWAVFKGLETYGGIVTNNNGTAITSDDFLVGNPSLISTAPGGITIGQGWGPQTSAAGDWYSQYCDYLVNTQPGAPGLPGAPNPRNWAGYSYWTGAMATGWYINILNATGAPPPVDPIIPEPGTMALFGLGLCGLAVYVRRRRNR